MHRLGGLNQKLDIRLCHPPERRGGADVVGGRKVAVTFGGWIGSFLLAFALGFGILTIVP